MFSSPLITICFGVNSRYLHTFQMNWNNKWATHAESWILYSWQATQTEKCVYRVIYTAVLIWWSLCAILKSLRRIILNTQFLIANCSSVNEFSVLLLDTYQSLSIDQFESHKSIGWSLAQLNQTWTYVRVGAS